VIKKIAIIGGAGGVGSTLAFFLGLKNRFEHISLIGHRRNLLETHLIDLRECFGEETDTTVSGGGYQELDGADLVIMAGAVTGDKVSSRDDYLKANLNLVKESAREIKNRAPQSLLISCTAPVDAYVMVFLREMGWDRHRLLGFCRNDSLRFRHLAARVLKLQPGLMSGNVLGEHGATQVPLFSTLRYKGEPLTVTFEQKAKITHLLSTWYGYWQSQNSQRTTTWTSATSIWRTLEALLLVPKEALGCPDQPGAINQAHQTAPGPGAFTGPWPGQKVTMGSVLLKGEYGLSEVALGVPICPGPLGWGHVLELKLWPEEQEALIKSAEKVKALYQSCS
jgi:L-lactate dehydrogenase/malate dehydrogenase